ncbi:type II toxin-antitoxin system Phd/YefM family antitoxin [Bradyrhizobium diazoefficiens]|jgi:prevent-host-death family protein|nr:type II toxin-antitoxin system Phd/YefM family antitoxin [Bradyrhizobium diazoefficiens]UCF54391.1 MAG: type II toxin-antitoxin system Phd/YefM family antitoxin [Bradyrhizobium sp.]MBR0968658.1 type II toxin-antitoxin system Phd/YefM family antitoxin [Bradyrhizobium diazoefficiens]MBR0981925.1 type II toxin-antitoxin system Phd/YefM family antitoxin [Bradyrhizobium diazoefficiens]MBR1011432.1 type II toxin-antitoxin system Phd/YefM family antitoxin [Bradyrhizobium diazoefficiens]MBR1017823.
MTTKRYSSKKGLQSGRWSLQDAKTHLSQIVREAQRAGPQRVTLHGKDAAVIIGAEEFDRLQRPMSGRDIVKALAKSPLGDLEFERLTIKSKVRDVEL